MKKSEKILITVASFAVLGFIIYVAQKKKKEKKLDSIADEGYETAEDVLYPLRGSKRVFG